MMTIPFEYVPISPKDKPWITPVIKMLINKRYKAFRAKQYDLYEHYKLNVKDAISRSKENWMSSTSRTASGLWKVVCALTNKKRNRQLSKLIESLGSPTKAAEEINKHFVELFSVATNLNAAPITQENDLKWNVNITEASVCYQLQRLKTCKAAGSDGVPPRLLKLAAFQLAAPLAHLFNLSVASTTFPDAWKIQVAHVVPIPKVTNPTIDELRPISKLPVISKVLEKFVLSSVKDKLIQIYGPNQFGFRPATSTLHAHIDIQEFVTTQLDHPSVKNIMMISFDMAKAFDKLSHEFLIRTLNRSKLPSGFVIWTKSYLTDRKQCVCLNSSSKSSMANVTSGVPQGAVLAPFLFAAHMGTLQPHSSSEAHMIKYADDVVTLLPIRKSTDARQLLTNEVEHVKSWCKANGLQLNESKTKVMYMLNSPEVASFQNSIQISDNLRILGITYEPYLKWNVEMEKRCKRPHSTFIFCANSKTFLKSPTYFKFITISFWESWSTAVQFF